VWNPHLSACDVQLARNQTSRSSATPMA